MTGMEGVPEKARMVAEVDATTLQEACDAYAKSNPTWAKDYDMEQMTHWGCRLWDNEADARASFG